MEFLIDTVPDSAQEGVLIFVEIQDTTIKATVLDKNVAEMMGGATVRRLTKKGAGWYDTETGDAVLLLDSMSDGGHYIFRRNNDKISVP